MDSEDIWKNADWTVQARNIVEAVKDFPESAKIIIILRHSHRNNPTKFEKMHEVKLTPQGHQIANLFGQKLPPSRTIRLYHSVVERCQETAEEILEGFESAGGIGGIKGILTPLFNAGTAPGLFLDIFKKVSPLTFMHRWAVGFYSPDIIIPFHTYCQNAAKIIWKNINKAQESGIDIHITHDIFLIALRYGWFGLPPDRDWVPFLGGIAFVLKENEIELYNKDKFLSIPNPYWWKNKRSQ